MGKVGQFGGLSFWVILDQAQNYRRWWLGAVGLALAERLFTFGYFVPTMLHLMGDNLPAPEVVPTALQHQKLVGAP